MNATAKSLPSSTGAVDFCLCLLPFVFLAAVSITAAYWLSPLADLSMVDVSLTFSVSVGLTIS